MLTTERLPASLYETICPACGGTVEFAVFQASFYNFVTYRGASTGALYRLDLDSCAYRAIAIPDALAPALKREGGADALRAVPDAVQCETCGHWFRGPQLTTLAPIGERHVQAVSLPLPHESSSVPT